MAMTEGVCPDAAFVDINGGEAGERCGRERADRAAAAKSASTAPSVTSPTHASSPSKVRSKSAQTAASFPAAACRSSTAVLPDSVRLAAPNLASLSSTGTDDED